ncbi:MAG: decarboxylating 6-phosphogluconate dehydrogenase [Chloroflexi bacterium]|nr:decarboxylating 6-phosphogluconate dehydrogenase [Chloroflexota bacterium]
MGGCGRRSSGGVRGNGTRRDTDREQRRASWGGLASSDEKGRRMRLGFAGLGRMGYNMATRLARGGHEVIAWNRTTATAQRLAGEEPNVTAVASIKELVTQLRAPRAVWVMVPSGRVTDEIIQEVAELLEPGDTIVDGGNSYFRDTLRRAAELEPRGISFVDEGTSGGIWGLQNGYCLMIGGPREVYERLEPAFATLAPPDGYLHCGPVGAGHFTKMVHNGIEYGMLQAYGEGFEILKSSQFDVDLYKVAHVWNQGSVVRSWLCELAERAFARDPKLDGVRGYVDDSGEGRWTILEAMNEDVPAPVITLSLMERFHSRQKESFSAQVIAALRNEFGGHAIKSERA